MTTAAREADLRELLAEATPGPWAVERQELDADFSDEDQEQAFPECVGPLWLAPGMSHDEPPQIEADVALVIAAVNALPSLLGALDAARAEVERLTRALYDESLAFKESAKQRGIAEDGRDRALAGAVVLRDAASRARLALAVACPAPTEEMYWLDGPLAATADLSTIAPPPRTDSEALYDDRAAWSERTFGPGDRYQGVVEHIRRELAEIERAPADLEEWVDVVMLAMDGAFRSAKADGAAFWAAFRAKAAKNEARQWAPPDAAGVVEHVRATVCPECGGPHPAAECEAD